MRNAAPLGEPFAPKESENLNVAMFLGISSDPVRDKFIGDDRWIAIGGPNDLVQAAIARLELVCDTYLSVSTPAQLAAAELLDRGAIVRDQIARSRTEAPLPTGSNLCSSSTRKTLA